MRSISLAALMILLLVCQVAFSLLPEQPKGQFGYTITHLFQNNLNFTDDVNHASFLLVQPSNQYGFNNKDSCAQFLEKPIAIADAQKDQDDLTRLIGYQTYAGHISKGQTIQLSDGTLDFDLSTKNVKFNSGSANSSQHLPILCSQSDAQTTTKSSLATAANQVSVTTVSNNTFQGYRNKKSFRFLGIPYSNNPARWSYATLNARENTLFDASSFGLNCPQSGFNSSDEDCLFLNIWSNYLPVGARSVKNLRPVLFWIHGGAFTGGSGSDPTFDGGNLVSRGDVVFVTINYRLANLGFLNIPNTNITGNYGLADQIVALQWVRKNIEAFGGDPNRITIWGQSAGASSVRALLASPVSRNSFAAAILGSNLGGYDYGTTYSHYYTPQQSYDVAGNATVTAAGCQSIDAATTIECLRRVSAYDLQNTVPKKSPANGNRARYIIVDGHYITEASLNVTDKRKVTNVPTLWGNVAEDAAAFLQYSASGTNRSTAINSVLFGDQASFAQAALAHKRLFPLGSSSPNNVSLNGFNLSAQIATDVVFRCIDQATVASALRHAAFPAAWYYQFERTYQPSGYDPNSPTCDAPKTAQKPSGDPSLPYLRCHSGELLFEFGNYANGDVVFRDEYDLPFTALIMDHWTSFARKHDPNPSIGYLSARGYSSTGQTLSKAGTWPESESQNINVRLLDVVPQQLRSSLRPEQCKTVGLTMKSKRRNHISRMLEEGEDVNLKITCRKILLTQQDSCGCVSQSQSQLRQSSAL